MQGNKTIMSGSIKLRGYYSLEEAVQKTGIPRRRFFQAISRCEIDPIESGKGYYVEEEDLLNFEKKYQATSRRRTDSAPEGYCFLKDAAEILGFPYSVVLEWARKGILPNNEKLGTKYLIPKKELEKFQPPKRKNDPRAKNRMVIKETDPTQPILLPDAYLGCPFYEVFMIDTKNGSAENLGYLVRFCCKNGQVVDNPDQACCKNKAGKIVACLSSYALLDTEASKKKATEVLEGCKECSHRR